MNFQKPLIIIILVSVVLIFIVGSYLAAESTVNFLRSRPRSFKWKLQQGEVWPEVQNFTWSMTDLGRGDVESTIRNRGVGNPSTNLTQLTGTETSNQSKPMIIPIRGKYNYSKREKAILRDSVRRILQHMDSDLKVQYFLQAEKYESRHSKPIHQLDVTLQWDFLRKFLGAAGCKQRFPDVINIGVKKSGTNALGFFITQHPLISHSIGNEVHFFDWNYHMGLDFYRSKMGFSTLDQLSFEKTPRYFVTDSAPKAILHDLGNRTKFILCVRDPISRLVSDFRHERELNIRRTGKRRNKKNISSSEELEGKLLTALILDENGNVNSSSDVVRTSSYSIHLRNWLKYYPLENFLFLDHDDLLSKTFQVMKRVESFLNLGTYFTKSMFYFDPVRGGPCMYHSDSQRPCPAKSTPGFLPKAKLSRETETKLREYFGPIIADFTHLTGQEFQWSNKYLR